MEPTDTVLCEDKWNIKHGGHFTELLKRIYGIKHVFVAFKYDTNESTLSH